MTYQEVQDRLSKIQASLQTINSNPSAELSVPTQQAIQQLQEEENILKERLLILAEEEGSVETNDQDTAEKLAKKGVNVKLNIKEKLKENNGVNFSVEETKSIAKVTGKATAKALNSLGDEVASMKATDIEENSFEIFVEYKNDSTDQFSFYIVDDTLHLVDFSFDKELVDVGVKPSGEALINVDLLANELTKHWKNMNEMKPGTPEAQERERFDRLSKKDQQTVLKIQAMMKAEKSKSNEGDGMSSNIKLSKGDPTTMAYTDVVKNEEEDKQGDLDIGHKDDEPDMLKQHAYDIAQYAAKLYKQLDKYDRYDGEVDFPNWWQSKVILARDYISKAQHYLEFEEKQPAIDALALEEGVNEGTELYNRNGINIKRFSGGKRGLMVQITYGGDYIQIPADEFPILAIAMQSVKNDLKDMSRQVPRSKNMNELSANKIKREYDELVGKMKQLAQHYKTAEGEKKEKIVAALKQHTARKKELEVALDKAIAGTGAGQELDTLVNELSEALNPEVSKKLDQFIKGMAKRYGYSEQDAVFAIMAALKQRDFDGLKEVIDEGATCCGRCGRVHVKGSGCKRPYLKGKSHCRNK
tara:strand:- start:2241 stop:3998 length:1758 start_codon:yes stop_codon:yes gene_type:complete